MKGVVAEFESVFRPHAQGLDSLIHFAELVKVPFVRKTDRWNLLVAQYSEKLGGHLDDFTAGHVRIRCRKVVNRNRDFALRWRLSVKKRTHKKHKGCQQDSLHHAHRRGRVIFQGLLLSPAPPKPRLSEA